MLCGLWASSTYNMRPYKPVGYPKLENHDMNSPKANLDLIEYCRSHNRKWGLGVSLALQYSDIFEKESHETTYHLQHLEQISN